jgi:hypothetical protein
MICKREQTPANCQGPLALEKFHDIYQTTELVYGVTRDSINKRITVVFRGTLSGYSEYTWDVSKSNWFANFNIIKKKGKMPDCLKDKLGDSATWNSTRDFMVSARLIHNLLTSFS